MNPPFSPQQAQVLQNRFGLRVAARLSAGAQDLPHDIEQRLRVARQQAVAQRKQAVAVTLPQAATAVLRNGNTATLNFGDEGMGWLGWLASAALVVALAAGLVTVNIVQDDDRTNEVADVDAALLTDDLPPQAYSDPGFLQYLRATADKRASTH